MKRTHSPINITVIVPTYRRPKDLARCLEALKQQTRQADEVLVVVRDTDAATWTLLKSFNSNYLPLCPVKVSIPGQVAASVSRTTTKTSSA